MQFNYKAVDKEGKKTSGTMEAVNKTVAVSALQRRELVVVSIAAANQRKKGSIAFFERVPLRDVVIMSRQISTLFESQVSALKAFTLLGTNTENALLQRKLQEIGNDLQAGSSISAALSKHPDAFSAFYVAMVRAGEESGRLSDVFVYLADYLDRQYALTTKTRNALIYPAFVIFVFLAVMILMFTLVIPNLGELLAETGQELPIYTKIIINISNFMVNYWLLILLVFGFGGAWLWRSSRTSRGKDSLDRFKISIPYVGTLYKKMYLSRIADNLNTMLSSGISIVRSLEITAEVVGNRVYSNIIAEAQEDVKAGSSLSKAMMQHPEMPAILVQMIQVGEETGSLGTILETLAKFYKREVDDAVDTLIGLIEPIMIIALALGVGVLLAAILLPIYNIASGIA